MLEINNSTPIAALTIGQFWELFEERYGKQGFLSQTNAKSPSGHYVHGLRGIQQLFGVSHKTAQEYKDGIIKDAVRQNGRKIVVDADLALELFNQRKSK
ncbi:MAG TPA: DUF3853 family protein [Rectinema sp.]|nr:DUF3853 family protein [Rectinema sp.]